MNTILVSYDLRAPGKDYTKLLDHFRSYGKRSKPLKSVWLIRTTLTAAQVLDAAVNYIDKNDNILAIDVTGRASKWRNLSDDNVKWIGSTM